MAVFQLASDAADRKLAATTQRDPVVESDQMFIWREELHDYFARMRQFNVMDPVDVFEHLSAFSARASEIRNLCMEHDSRRNNNFRIREIDPFIEECDRQFKIHSRILSVKEVEARLAGGSFA